MTGWDIACLIFFLAAFFVIGWLWGDYNGSKYAAQFLKSRMCDNCIQSIKKECEERDAAAGRR